jgi:hypothetical protein
VVSVISLVAYKTNSETSLMWLALYTYTGCPKNGVLTVLYGVEEITVKVRKMLKKFYWTYLLHWRYLKVHLTGQLFRNICIKLSWQLPLIVHIITKYKITHYQHLIGHNREFRTFGNRKNYFKFTTVTLQGNDVRLYLCLHCIIINNNNWFFGLKIFFSFFFMYSCVRWNLRQERFKHSV